MVMKGAVLSLMGVNLNDIAAACDQQRWVCQAKGRDGRGMEMTPAGILLHRSADETILILESSIVVESATMPPTCYSPGDVIFFKEGAHAKWHVEGRVKNSPSAARRSRLCSPLH
jgi:uncharacterized cupin superfamily protein